MLNTLGRFFGRGASEDGNNPMAFLDEYAAVMNRHTGLKVYNGFKRGGGLVWFCGPGVLRVVGCYWWCCAHWRAYWLGESQPSALWGCSSL